MVEKTQINIRVTEAQKSKWQQYAEENHGSLTKLIQFAVGKEIDGTADGSDSASDDTVTELQQTVDRLENTVSDMDTRLQAVHSTVQATGPDISLKSAVRETLQTPYEVSGDSLAEYGLLPSQVAARLDADTDDVTDALDTLFEQEPEVVFEEMNGERYYFKRGRE